MTNPTDELTAKTPLMGNVLPPDVSGEGVRPFRGSECPGSVRIVRMTSSLNRTVPGQAGCPDLEKGEVSGKCPDRPDDVVTQPDTSKCPVSGFPYREPDGHGTGQGSDARQQRIIEAMKQGEINATKTAKKKRRWNR